MTHSAYLPDFESPPLAEVAMSLQFERIIKLGHVDLGLLWSEFKTHFPRVEYHPALAPAFETFGLRQGLTQEVIFNLSSLAALPRTWFIAADEDELLQFQADRFVHNWRKSEPTSTYPRYEAIRTGFEAELKTLEAFLERHGFGKLVPNQCELTYVNIITGDGPADPISKVFKGWSSLATPCLGEAEDLAFSARFIINDGASEPVGRVIAQSVPALDRNGQPVIQFTLVGRGPPRTPTIQSALDFMDLAREKIVCGFAELTTDEMHNKWKRRV